jgi:hypothetical protein
MNVLWIGSGGRSGGGGSYARSGGAWVARDDRVSLFGCMGTIWLGRLAGLTPDCAAVWASAGDDKLQEAARAATVSSIAMRSSCPHLSARLPAIASGPAKPSLAAFNRMSQHLSSEYVAGAIKPSKSCRRYASAGQLAPSASAPAPHRLSS